MLHDQFMRQTKELGRQNRCQWLQNGTPKRETETLICAVPKNKSFELIQVKGRLTNYKNKQNVECVVGLMRQLNIL